MSLGVPHHQKLIEQVSKDRFVSDYENKFIPEVLTALGATSQGTTERHFSQVIPMKTKVYKTSQFLHDSKSMGSAGSKNIFKPGTVNSSFVRFSDKEY
jgi:hypothetical protein